MASGAGKLYVISRYRELDLNGLTNQDALKEYKDGQFSEHWRDIPDYLVSGAFKYTHLAAILAASFFALNSIILFFMLPAKNGNEEEVK